MSLAATLSTTSFIGASLGPSTPSGLTSRDPVVIPLNVAHALYANLTRSLASDPVSPRLLDQTGGTAHTAEQTSGVLWTSPHPATGVAPEQGIAFDGTHFYGSGSPSISKYDAAGNLVITNSNPYAGLPAGLDHIGDGFVHNGLWYLGMNKQGTPKTLQTIAVFNTSDLSLNTSFDVSAQTDFTGAGLCLSHNNTIYGISYSDAAVSNAMQTTVWEFNLSTGAFIQTHTLGERVIGMQGMTWTGDYYVISSYDLVNTLNRVKFFEQNLASKLYEYRCTGISDPVTHEIEGVDYYNGKLYVHALGQGIRYGSYAGMYVNKTEGAYVQAIDAADLPEEGTIVIRMTTVSEYSFSPIFNNNDLTNGWKAYLDVNGTYFWRLDAGTTISYDPSIAPQTETIVAFTWKRTGATATIKIGINGSYVASSATSAWLAVPVNGIYLGGSTQSGGNVADTLYSDVVVYNKELTAGEWSSLAANFDGIYL